MANLAIQLARELPAATLRKTGEWGFTNAKANLPYIKRTIVELERSDHSVDSTVVLGGGPSLRLKNPARVLTERGYRGELVATDAALGYCLRNGIVPPYVVSVDSQAYRVLWWYGDPDLESRPPDDFYRRRDFDSTRSEELRANELTTQLVNEHGPAIKAIIATSVDPCVTRRCLEAGMEIYWWNPLYDDFEQPDSYSRRVYDLTGVPCMTTGGNVGASAFVFAETILHARNVALVGFDMSYAPGTPLRNTQYYYEIVELLGERAPDAFIEIQNPHTKETWFSDPTFYWYRQNLLEIIAVSNCKTYNCTEGGILFGDNVRFTGLSEFLQETGGITK